MVSVVSFWVAALSISHAFSKDTGHPTRCPDFASPAYDTDLAGILIAEQWATSSEDCCSQCGVEDQCEGFAYLDHKCYLKRNFTGTFPKVGVITRLRKGLGSGCPGFAMEKQDKDLEGDLLEDWYAPNPDACCAACADKPDCQGFAFLGNRCYLKGNVQGTYEHEGCMIRVKEGVLPDGGSTPTPPLTCRGFAVEKQNKDLVGDLLEDKYAPNPNACCAACSEKPDCQGFAFLGSRCYLKGNVQGTYEHEGCMIRVKQGVLPDGGSTPFPTPSFPQFEELMYDTDIAGELLDQTWAASSDGCIPLCAEMQDCEAFAYHAQICYLKRTFSGTIQKIGVTSRIRADLGVGCPGFTGIEEDKDLAGNLIDAWHSRNPGSCCAACARRQACQGFAFIDDACYLKSDLQGTYDHEGCIVRMKSAMLGGRGGSRRLVDTSVLV